MPDINPETVSIPEPAEAKIRGFFSVVKDRFKGQQPIIHEVQRAIQPTVEPNPASLPQLDQILEEFANAADWQEMPYDMGYLSSGEPVGEQPEWVEDYLHIYSLPPGTENGDSWVRMVVHKGRKGPDGKPVATEPYAMISYYPRGKAEDGSQTSLSRMEVLFFSRWDSAIQKEFASVTRVYQERTPPATPPTPAV